MKICFVQPETEYQIKVNRYALAQTFPQIILSFGLEPSEYCIYIFGKSTEPFEQFLLANEVTLVLVTAITSTFPKAVEIARIAKGHGIATGIGGIFATMNAQKIIGCYNEFDFILTGHSNLEMLNSIRDGFRGIINGPKEIGQMYSTGDVATSDKFSMYDENDTICYELTNGCHFSCTYCTIKAAFNTPCLFSRKDDIIKRDLSIFSKKWHKLKLIDDDISLAFRVRKNISFHAFSQVIAEVRADNISDELIRRMKDTGITHLLFGIETLDNKFVMESKKSIISDWEKRCMSAVELCKKYNIICRPIIMLTNPNTTLEHFEYLITKISDWTPDNLIEVLFSFYTPHPGLPIKINKEELVNNNLTNFDHLHLVYKPPAVRESEIPTLIKMYDELVRITQSKEYNPQIEYLKEKISEYDIFFADLLDGGH